MKITESEALKRLEASPAIAAEFDKLRGSKTRREAVAECLDFMVNVASEGERLKQERQKAKDLLATLERKTPAPRSATASPTPAPAQPAPSPKFTLASDFAVAPLIMERKQFDLLTPQDKTRYLKAGNKLV